MKANDDLLQQLRLLRNGLVDTSIDVTSIKFGVKFVERNEAIVTGTSWVPVGTGEARVYRHATTLTSAALTKALHFGAQKVPIKELAGTELAKRLTQFLGAAEYEIKYVNTGGDTVGRNPAVWTTRTVPIEIVSEVIPNA